MEDIAVLFQRMARETNEAAAPANITMGVVESINPLEIRVDQMLILNEMQLMLTRNVMDYELEMTVDHITENNTDGVVDLHNHEYKGKKTFLVHNALKVGDNVMMIRNKGGQIYVVLDKVVDP